MTGSDKPERPRIAAMERGMCAGQIILHFVTATGPGPGRYTLPNLTGVRGHDFTKKVQPAYSFGTKLATSCKKQEQTIMSLLSFSFFLFFIVFRKTIGPGPAHFVDPSQTRHGKDGTPHYSLYSRHKELEPFKTPGPAAYSPEKHPDPHTVRGPTHIMGIRTRYRKSKQWIMKLNYNLNLLFVYIRGFQSFSSYIYPPSNDWWQGPNPYCISLLLNGWKEQNGWLWHWLCQDSRARSL